ncbi:MAG: transglutaminase domain-containing protein, partial [Deltaproteobacteria bacterium]|nr:transglutaminase domain-containing protein [Deltaproteobacteria bacterium]
MKRTMVMKLVPALILLVGIGIVPVNTAHAQKKNVLSPDMFQGLRESGRNLQGHMQQADDLLYRIKVKRAAGHNIKKEQVLLDDASARMRDRYEAALEQLDAIGRKLQEAGRDDLLAIHEQKTEKLRSQFEGLLENLESGDRDDLIAGGLAGGKRRKRLMRDSNMATPKARRTRDGGDATLQRGVPGSKFSPLKRAPRESITENKQKKLFPKKRDKFGLLNENGTYKMVSFTQETGTGSEHVSHGLINRKGAKNAKNKCVDPLCDLCVSSEVPTHRDKLGSKYININDTVAFDLDLPQHARPVLVAGLGDPQGLLSPATRSAATPPSADDLAEDGLDVVFSDDISALADSLDNDPIKLYEYVKNTIPYQPYFGALKGAAVTLAQKSGNDLDQASLMIALLRSSGYPARYGRALVTVDIERAKQWLGVDDDTCVDLMLATGEIPGVTALVDDVTGKIMAVRFEHIYVEAWLPYGHYRGQVRDTTHKLWVPLAPAFKKVRDVAGIDIAAAVPFDGGSLAEYLEQSMQKNSDGSFSGVDSEYISEQIGAYAEQVQAWLPDNMTIQELNGYTEIVPESSPILPITLPFASENVTRFSTVATSLHYRLRVRLAGDEGIEYHEARDSVALDWEIPYQSIIGKRLTMSYEPTNFDDISGVACYLVQMQPHIRLAGEVVVAGSEVTMGVDNVLRIETLLPSSNTGIEHSYDHVITAGDYAAIIAGLDGDMGAYLQKGADRLGEAVAEETEDRDRIVGEQLNLTGLLWFYQVDGNNKTLARQYKVRHFRKPHAIICYGHLKPAFIS